MFSYLEGMNIVEGQEETSETELSTEPPVNNNNNNNKNNNNNTNGNIEPCKKIYIMDGGCDTSTDKGKCNESYIKQGDTYLSCEWADQEEGSKDIQCRPSKTCKKQDDSSTKPKKSNLADIIKNLEEDISENFNKDIATFLQEINNKCGNLGDKSDNTTQYINNIKQFNSLLDFGDLRNSDELDFIENKIISFINISDTALEECLKKIYGEDKLCSIDLNINILLILAILYNQNNSEFDNIKNNDLIKVDRILDRLSKYFPDLFQKILNVMKLCDPNSTRYIILENIYKTTFKYNNTTVNLDFFEGFKKIIDYLRNLKTIEMVIIIICITFVISKIIGMFSVKVST